MALFNKKKKDESDKDEMSFIQHLEILRWHLIRSVLVIVAFAIVLFLLKEPVFEGLIFAPKFPDFFTYRFICGFSDWIGLGDRLCFGPPEFKIIGVGFGELFITHIKVSIILGFVMAFPYIFWEFWRFIKPGLHTNEKKVAGGVVFICSSLFLLGVCFGYYVISPFAVSFLAGYQLPGAVSQPTISSYVNYMVMFTVPSGLTFELPVVVYFLARVGLVTAEFMRKYRRHAFVIILILASVITPPDAVTQLLIGVPLYVLYEVSILIAQRVQKQEEEKEKEDEIRLQKTNKD